MPLLLTPFLVVLAFTQLQTVLLALSAPKDIIVRVPQLLKKIYLAVQEIGTQRLI